ncbi:MAG: hypothetical protein PVG03_16005 [Desulfarculaceae bacterium]
MAKTAANTNQGAPPSRPKRRKIVYIKKKFQRDFIIKFCFVALGSMLLASAMVYFLTADTVTASYRYNRLSLERTADAIIPALIASNLAVLVAFIIATIYVTLYISHKIAGPLFRFEQDIKEVAQGNLMQRFRLREGDQLTDFVGQLNNLTQSLQERVRDIQNQVAALKEKAHGTGWEAEAAQREIDKLHEDLTRLFKTE